MPQFTVHTIPGSPYGRAVLATLEEKGQPYRISPVAPPALREPPHLSRHPFGRIPALEHGDFMLYETQAILRYLDRLVPEPRFTPTTIRAAARMDQVMNVNDWYLFQGVGDVIGFQRIVVPVVLGTDPDEAAIAAAMPRAQVVFAELARLLGEGPYFTGEETSLADLLVAPQLDILSGTPEWRVLTGGQPNLVRWLERMNARPSFQRTTWARVAEMAAG
ncbi:MAG TPA: glutathione S-transferase family protein [Azospirillaceae bacterium]|nr:glutathione S-transferase family protein [Azospirillaceae bacterium]